MSPHQFECRVYYEDTDLAGIVYYANYLKYIERARSEFVRTLGVDQTVLRAESGLVFVVRRVEADYLKPARFDDILRVETSLQSHSGARLSLLQNVFCGADLLFCATVTLIVLADSGKPARIPAGIRRSLSVFGS